jgi:DNA-binding transcriptional MerR regulator
LYKVHEFAELAGVTVRALHHYDRLGLLKPKGRTARGYRLYSDNDLARLEQIVVLKFLGLPLKQIGELLLHEGDLRDSLRRQQAVLAMKRGQLDAAIQAIEQAEVSLAGEPDWGKFTRIIREIEMQNETEWTKKYYGEQALAAVEDRKALWSPELQERLSREWAALFAEVEAALGEDPSSAKAQELAARWRKLVGEFTGGNPLIQKGLNNMYADQGNWPQGQQSYRIEPQIMTFILAAMKGQG